MNLIPDSGHWHKFWSVRLALLSAVVGALELTLPLWHGIVPPHAFAAASTALAVAAAAARVVRQRLDGEAQ
jgi:hypothetical protein